MDNPWIHKLLAKPSCSSDRALCVVIWAWFRWWWCCARTIVVWKTRTRAWLKIAKNSWVLISSQLNSQLSRRCWSFSFGAGAISRLPWLPSPFQTKWSLPSSRDPFGLFICDFKSFPFPILHQQHRCQRLVWPGLVIQHLERDGLNWKPPTTIFQHALEKLLACPNFGTCHAWA